MNDLEKVMSAVRKHCLNCSGGSLSEVKQCRVKDCALYEYRCAGAKVAPKRGKPKGQLSMEELIG